MKKKQNKSESDLMWASKVKNVIKKWWKNDSFYNGWETPQALSELGGNAHKSTS